MFKGNTSRHFFCTNWVMWTVSFLKVHLWDDRLFFRNQHKGYVYWVKETHTSLCHVSLGFNNTNDNWWLPDPAPIYPRSQVYSCWQHALRASIYYCKRLNNWILISCCVARSLRNWLYCVELNFRFLEPEVCVQAIQTHTSTRIQTSTKLLSSCATTLITQLTTLSKHDVLCKNTIVPHWVDCCFRPRFCESHEIDF